MEEKLTKEALHFEVVVVGGGTSGLCAALASARHGAKTALVQNRPVLGGNASSEIRMHICGADCHGSRPEARETGILEEILLENRYVNPQISYSVFDTVMWEKAAFQENLTLLLNTHMFDVEATGGKVEKIFAVQLTTEKLFEISGDYFVDATGDGMLSYQAGAQWMMGREGKDVFGERIAPARSDHITMGNSLMFTTRDMGHPVPFHKPAWAYTYTEDDLTFRGHDSVISGYWWIELGGKDEDVIKDGEVLRDELIKSVYGVWDHIKNGGDHGAENLVLEWVGMLPGKRESRRIVGDYVLKADDLLDGRVFEDAVAYGGWPMDMHVAGGLKSDSDEPTEYFQLDDVYTIPYRCLYAKGFDNLFLAGRNISVSHMAFGSTRDMATTSVVGQAVGTAAAMAARTGVSPRELLADVGALQQQLLKDDCYIPGYKNEDGNDLARGARISASSQREAAGNVINGTARNTVRYPEGWHFKDYKEGKAIAPHTIVQNAWVSQTIGAQGEWLALDFDRPIHPGEIRLTFDSNLSKEIMPTIIEPILKNQVPGIPPQLVKDYDIVYLKEGAAQAVQPVRGNYLRHRVHAAPQGTACDRIEIRVLATHGDESARIFEVRVYE